MKKSSDTGGGNSSSTISSLYSGIFDRNEIKNVVKSNQNDLATSNPTIELVEKEEVVKPQAWSASLRFAPRKNNNVGKVKRSISSAMLASASQSNQKIVPAVGFGNDEDDEEDEEKDKKDLQQQEKQTQHRPLITTKEAIESATTFNQPIKSQRILPKVLESPSLVIKNQKRKRNYNSFQLSSLNMFEEYNPQIPNDFKEICQLIEIQNKSQDEIESKIQESDDYNSSSSFTSETNSQIIINPFKNSISFAEKILLKQGWKPGESLGLNNNKGLIEPIQVEKIKSKNSKNVPRGKIIHPQEEEKKLENFKLFGEPSKIVLLENLILKDEEIDQEIRIEINQECKKFGLIKDIYIWSIEQQQQQEQQEQHHHYQQYQQHYQIFNPSPKIFIEFQSLVDAWNYVKELNNRFFAGNCIKASFYSIENFNKVKSI